MKSLQHAWDNIGSFENLLDACRHTSKRKTACACVQRFDFFPLMPAG